MGIVDNQENGSQDKWPQIVNLVSVEVVAKVGSDQTM